MRTTFNLKNVFIEVVALLFVLLFVYAAVSKLLDYENFQVQIERSPLLSAFAIWISWLVLLLELIIAVLLTLPKSRRIGLYMAMSLMTMFSAYIFIMLHYSSFVPCSCGGILEKMSWDVHLIFNLFFVGLSISALLLKGNSEESNLVYPKTKHTFKWIPGLIFFSVGSVIILFLCSENIMHYENPFIRRFPHHPAEFVNKIDLKFNSFYFAGSDSERIYLGNYTTPDQLVSLNRNLQQKKINKIIFDPKKIPFHIVTTAVQGKYFYLLDGTVPKIYRGSTTDWKITKELKGIPHFTRAVPMDSIDIAFRSNHAAKAANILGVFNSENHSPIKYNKELLQKQIDGIFDTDGTLLYSEKLKKIVYLYFYRNQFIVADKEAKLNYRGNTIDTITHVKIKVRNFKNGTERALSSPSYVVNPHAAVLNNLLFVHSAIRGRLENKKLWEQAFIIDVYDLDKNSYLFSFPIYHTGSRKMHSLLVTSTHLFAIIGNDLVVYQFRDTLLKEIK